MTPKCPDCKREQDECICVPLENKIAELEQQLVECKRDAERYLKAIKDYDAAVKLKESRVHDQKFDWKDAEAVDYIDHEEIMASLELQKIAAMGATE